MIGSSVFTATETQGEEPKWTPHPYQPPSASTPAAQPVDTRLAAAGSGSEFAPVQRWRKTESTTRESQTQRPETPRLVFPEPSSNPAASKPLPPREVAQPMRSPADSIANAKHEGNSLSSRKSVVPAQWTPDDGATQEAALPMAPVRLKTPPIEKDRLIYQDANPVPANPPGIPNPFSRPGAADETLPGSKPPSDAMNAMDLPPAPPRETRRSGTNCDAVRDFVDGLDIRRIRVDSSPAFVEGYPTKDRSLTNTKENFIAEATDRAWYSLDGEEIARGRLVDLVFDSVVIQKLDGTKITYLLRKLSDPDQVYVSEAWGVPVTCSLGDQGVEARMFADSVLTWKASGVCHKPLYFEDVQLERYGHEWGPVVQPALSTVRFFGDLAVLPYKMGIHPPHECQYPLGYYRPGQCAPWTHGPVPISLRGALSQAAFVTGTAWALP